MILKIEEWFNNFETPVPACKEQDSQLDSQTFVLTGKERDENGVGGN